MLSEYEKKAIEDLNSFKSIRILYGNKFTMFLEQLEKYQQATDIALNLITKLQKENKEKDKQINLMAEYMEENMDEYQLDEIYAKQYNCNGMERNWTRGKEKEIADIKQYFEKLAKEKGE